MSRPIVPGSPNDPTAQARARAATEERQRRQRADAERRAAEGRASVGRFFTGVRNFFTADRGQTDAERAATRARDLERERAETAAVLTRWQADARARAAAETPTAEERRLREARNTRIDQLTPEQRTLIRNAAFGTAATTAAAGVPAAAASTNAETRIRRGVGNETPSTNGRSSSGRSNGVTGSQAGPVEINFRDAPSPSEESQPRLVNDVRQGARFTSSGQRIAQSFNINSFRSEILDNDVLSTHSYLVTFAPFRSGFDENAPLTRFVTNKRNTLMLRCENVVLPTASLLEEENIRRYGYGPVEKVPYGVQFSDVTMTWLVDKNSELIDFFNQWMNTIVMHDSPNTRMTGGARRPGLQDYSPFEIGYKDAYTNPIVRISVYNKQNETTTTYEMYDVFPMNIQAMNLSWADENELQRLTVTFAYTNMKVRAPRARDDIPQENFVSSGRIPPLMERLERLDNTNVPDAAASPGNETSRTTVGASTPNATEPVPPPPISPDLPGLPAIRDFTSPPPP